MYSIKIITRPYEYSKIYNSHLMNTLMNVEREVSRKKFNYPQHFACSTTFSTLLKIFKNTDCEISFTYFAKIFLDLTHRFVSFIFQLRMDQGSIKYANIIRTLN